MPGREIRQGVGGNNPERTAEHRTKKQAGAEHPACKAKPHADRHDKRLGKQQTDQKCQAVCFIKRIIHRAITDTDDLRKAKTNNSNHKTGNRRPTPKRRTRGIGNLLNDGNGTHRQHCSDPGQQPQKCKCGKFPERLNVMERDQKRHFRSVIKTGNHRPHHRRHHNRCKSGPGIMAKNHFMGKKHPGQRRIEGCGNGRCHPAPQQGARRPAAQMQHACKPSPKGRPHMDNRPLATK